MAAADSAEHNLSCSGPQPRCKLQMVQQPRHSARQHPHPAGKVCQDKALMLFLMSSTGQHGGCELIDAGSNDHSIWMDVTYT